MKPKLLILILSVIMTILSAGAKAPFEKPRLKYAPNALEPAISAETIEFHYGKHLQAYINNLNNLVEGTKFAEMSLDEIVLQAEGGILNNGAQSWNHICYFDSFSPKAKTAPGGKLLEAINRDFGSLEAFKEQFNKAAATLFGSGWAWLSADKNGKLVISAESNAGNPLRAGLKPLLTIDVWEHAYYIDYRNRRPDAIAAFWKLLDWSVVEARFDNKP